MRLHSKRSQKCSTWKLVVKLHNIVCCCCLWKKSQKKWWIKKTFRCSQVEENEWEISWYKLLHLLSIWKRSACSLASLDEGTYKYIYMEKEGKTFSISTLTFIKGFNKWMEFYIYGKQQASKKTAQRSRCVQHERNLFTCFSVQEKVMLFNVHI